VIGICFSARRRHYEQSTGFKDKYGFRAGVEATMSEFDRRTGVKHLRFRTMKAEAFAVMIQAIGLNILQSGRVISRNNKQIILRSGVNSILLAVFNVIKERTRRQPKSFVEILQKSSQ
jgi:hypothetical protein